MNIRSEIIYKVELMRRSRLSTSPSFKRERKLIIDAMLHAFTLMGKVDAVVYDFELDIWQWRDTDSNQCECIDCYEVF